MSRAYIPLPGGWEVQTKGNGSTFRILDKKAGERMPIPLPDRILDFLERMAREIHAASPTVTLAACFTEAQRIHQTLTDLDSEYERSQQAAITACKDDPGLTYPVYLLLIYAWNDGAMWAEKPEIDWFAPLKDDDGPPEPVA